MKKEVLKNLSFCKIYETWGELHFGPVSLLLHKSLKAVIELDSYDLAQKLGLRTQLHHYGVLI